jgi:putrescine transport system substrate-binding protein
VTISCAKEPAVPTGPTPSVVNFANWFDYIGPHTLKEFTDETGIEVNYDVYDSDETLDAKLLAGHSGYDVVVPTSNSFARQRAANVFQPLDWSKLHNAHEIDRDLLAQLEEVDPGNRFAVPHSWGTTGIGFDVDRVRERLPDAPLDSWALVFDPAAAARFADCGITLLDSPGDVVRSALLYLGRDAASESDADLRDAIRLLQQIQPYVRYFHNSQWVDDLANGEICVVLGWSGAVALAGRTTTRTLRYVIPKEGALLWFEVMAIPTDAEHVENAYRLIDHLLRPNVAADFTNATFYPSAVSAATAGVEPAILAQPSVYPDAGLRARLRPNPPETPAYERRRLRLWTSMKAGQAIE